MDQVKNIIAAVGKFPQDAPVLARAAEIARSHEARLTIVHIIESLTGFEFASPDLRLIQHQMRASAFESIEAAMAKHVSGVADVDVRIETGSPSQRLVELIDEVAADLVVMRAHQRNSIIKKIVGSTTDRVVRSSPVPVLVVKRPVARDYKHIVVSIDTSDSSDALAPYVAALFPLAKLTLIHFVQIPHQFEAAMLRAGSGQSMAAHRDALINKAKVSLRALSKQLEDRLESSVTRVVVGDPATSLVRSTWSRKVNLIVVGSGGSSKLRPTMLGSVTRRLLRDAACDVLVCRTNKQDAEP